jgi:hypothetical protein
MQIIFLHEGKRAEGVVLAAGNNRMRVAVRNQSDTVELWSVGGHWALETGEPVEIEALVPLLESRGAGDFVQVGLLPLGPMVATANWLG